jgi:SpoVK/Ycf46/Vps4 family AAA+-type ATPase
MNREERQIVLHYLGNMLKRPATHKRKSAIVDWANDVGCDLFKASIDELYEKQYGEETNHRISRHNYKETGCKYAILKSLVTETDLPQGRLYSNAQRITDDFRLNQAESVLLNFFVNSEHIGILQDLVNSATDQYGHSNTRHSVELHYLLRLGPLLGLREADIGSCLDVNSRLLSTGLLYKTDRDWFLSKHLVRLILSPPKPNRKLKDILLDEKARATLTSDDFDYMADEYDYLRELLGNVLKRRDRGVNILLYGNPGTGKTEFAKTLCADAKADLYLLSENSENSGGGDRNKRLSELAMAKALTDDEPHVVLLMDEAEDVFSPVNSFTKTIPSKIYINRLLEKNRTPVIWISNNIDDMDSAYLRRFTYTLRMDTPCTKVRSRIWKRTLNSAKIRMDEKDVAKMARDYKLPPSFAASAVKAAKIVNDSGAIERTLKSLEQAITGQRKIVKEDKPVVFNQALLHTDTDLGRLTERVVVGRMTRFSLCLYGAPGTGKSEYARHLAEKMGFEVLHKRASDLMSKWVGGTEKNIAAAFEEARQDGALLVFDEADSLLQDRERAVRSWEVSQVNEMLTWMENHPYPFVCTTNLMGSLDKASLRRFTFKVKFDYLTPQQAELAFQHFFGQKLRVGLTALTPGDFAVVKSKAAILGVSEPAELLALLAEEQEAKGVKATDIGF